MLNWKCYRVERSSVAIHRYDCHISSLGWRVTFRANIYGPLLGGMVILQLCRWMLSHTQKLCSRLYSIEIEFY